MVSKDRWNSQIPAVLFLFSTIQQVLDLFHEKFSLTATNKFTIRNYI